MEVDEKPFAVNNGASASAANASVMIISAAGEASASLLCGLKCDSCRRASSLLCLSVRALVCVRRS
jgi:hypothetical protein